MVSWRLHPCSRNPACFTSQPNSSQLNFNADRDCLRFDCHARGAGKINGQRELAVYAFRWQPSESGGDDTQLAAHLGEGRNGTIDLLRRVCSTHLGADARLALRYHREEEADHIDPFTQ